MIVPIVAELQKTLHESLDGIASELLLVRLKTSLAAAGGDRGALREACLKIEKTVSLFVGPEHGKATGKRLRERLDRGG